MGTPGQQKAGCWLALLCTCCICLSLQQGTSRIDPGSLCVSRAAAHRTHCRGHPPRHANATVWVSPQARSEDHLSKTKSLPASRKPITQGLSNAPAWLWSRPPSPSAQPALCPQCQAQGKGAPCMSMPVMVFPPSPFPAQPRGVHQPHSNLAPGGDPSASSPHETLPMCC